MAILSQSILADNLLERCYNLTTETHCFKTVKTDNGLLQNFTDASRACSSTPGYALAKIENAEVQAKVEQFLEEFELTSDDVWIAARRTTQAQWKWVNGSVYSDG